MSFVVAGGIVRNRAWVLNRHLGAVRLNKPDQMFYVTGDNADGTKEVLRIQSFYSGAKWGYADLSYLVHDTGEPGYTRDGSDGPRYRSAHMAAERNLWAAEALKRWPQATHLWVVDSDVLPENDVLEKLLAVGQPVVGAWVPGCTPAAGWNFGADRAERTGAEDSFRVPFFATMLGGSYLVERRVFYPDPGLEGGDAPFYGPWREHPQGEDGGFGDTVRALGFQMWADPGARCRHLMERDSIPVACSDCGVPMAFRPEKHPSGGVLVCGRCAEKRGGGR
jgi:hypothetical protein